MPRHQTIVTNSQDGQPDAPRGYLVRLYEYGRRMTVSGLTRDQARRLVATVRSQARRQRTLIRCEVAYTPGGTVPQTEGGSCD